MLIVANSLNDLPTRRPTSRSVSPVASGSRSKSASNKKNQRNKLSSKEDFQAPVGVPIANRKSSTTILGTPRNQKTINDYTSSGGSHQSRKQSYEDSSLQMQLVNRQTIEVKKLIDNNNVDLEEKIAKMINKGETSMLNRLEEILVARDNALERRLTQQILDGDRKLTNQMNDRLRENEINIERKIDISITDCQSNLKLDLARSINDSMARFTSRLDNMEESTYASTNGLEKRIGVLSQKQDTHHSEMMQGLGQIEELKGKAAQTARRMDDLVRSTDEQLTRLGREVQKRVSQMDENLAVLNDGLKTIDSYKESMQNTNARCNELAANYNAISIRITQLEADKSVNQEQMSMMKSRVEAHDTSINVLTAKNEDREGSSKYAQHMEIEHRNLNVLISCLPLEFHSIKGLRRFSRNFLQHDIGESELVEVFKVGMSNRGDIVKARFATINARTRFYKARTRLGPNNNIWMNDDLTKQQETLAYQARQLYQTGKIFRTWTYMNSVFIQRLPTDNALK